LRWGFGGASLGTYWHLTFVTIALGPEGAASVYTGFMATPIQALPVEVIHLMAAGEVIDALAAVVRELAENAIDAKATRISIALWSESWRVRVTDNGSGMTQADLEQAALAHSTSKIQTQADLWQINSLGFRGEALHSLARLAELEICSRSNRPEQSGYQVSYSHQGQPQQIQPIAMATGTTVTVSDLFGSWPSRRQALPQQLRGVQQAIQHLALCHPQMTWQVEHNERLWFSIWGSPTAEAILTQLLRLRPGDLRSVVWPLAAVEPNLEPNEAKESGPPSPPSRSTQLELLLGLPDRCHRRRLDWLKIAVNGRMVRFPELEQTLLASLRRTLPRDRYPVGFLHLHLPPDQVDWNRHPAKAELYLSQLGHWQSQTQQAVEQLLSLGEQASLADLRLSELIKVAEAEGVYRTSRSLEANPDSELEADPELNETNRPLVPLKAVAQVHSMYILAEHPSGLWLIEQHIAHERVLYEQLCDHWQLVPLEMPLVLGQLSSAQQTQLQRLGLEPEAFGEDRWAVRTAPAVLAQRPDCAAALIELSLGGDLDTALVATACRTAIRNGLPLTLPEMQSLLDQWQSTRNPRTCPHGRPIYLSFEESSLARFFRRHWVIGKSHGI
jgi:DNA mismatch repair protein MutL